MLQALLFLFMGLAGSAGPGHFGMRVLAYRQHLDRGLPFAAGTEDGGFGYSWWLMCFRQSTLGDSALRQFGNLAGFMGWLTLVGVAGTAICITLNAGLGD